MLAVIVGSLLLHATVVGTLAIGAGAPLPLRPHEISVELVQAPPPPKPEPQRQVAKAEPPKPAPPAPEPAKPDPPKPPPPKPEVAKADPPKADPPKTESPKPAPPPAPKAPPPAEQRVADLQKELAALKAEHDALTSAKASDGTGSLADSLQAIALPTASDGAEGEAASYQQIVFSQLAKAKGIGRKQGRAGTAGVQFEVDAAGRLLDVAIVIPSGVETLDAEALDIVRKAAPFPPPPEGAQHQFVANVNFVPEGAQ